jgi:hypothetical protein
MDKTIFWGDDWKPELGALQEVASARQRQVNKFL